MLGVVVLVVAIIALNGPSTHSVKAGSQVPVGSRTAHQPTTSGTPTTSTTTRSTATTSSTSARPHTTAPKSTSAANTPAAKVPLVVLNNTTITGLAQQASHRFETGGWTVTKYDNYQNDIISTCAYYDADTAGAKAAALALQKQFPTIKRVEPQFAELSTWHSPIVVILTPDYSPD